MENDHHNLAFPIKQFETATSYASRLTRYCGLSSPTDLCLDFGFRWQDFVRGDDALFEKMAQVGGVSAADLKRWAVRSIAPGRFEVSGQSAVKSSLVRSRVRLCPQCIMEGRGRQGDSGMYRRHFWHFLSVRTCPDHDAPLLWLSPDEYTIQNYDFAGKVLRNWSEIENAAASNEKRYSTELEAYVLQRLEGISVNPFLDAMPLFIATRFCEVLGFVLLCGPKQQISRAPEDMLARAAQVGFEALQTGEEGLYDALESLVTQKSSRTVRHQSDFGALFEWLRTSSLGNGFEPVRDMVRGFILRTYPLREGDTVLGQKCERSTVYTITGAWQAVGIQRERMNRYLLDQGIARIDPLDNEVWLNRTLTADDVRRISKQMSNRLSCEEASGMLNTSLQMLQFLREWAIIVPKEDALDQVPKYEKDDLVQLATRLAARAHITPAGARHMVKIVDGAKRLRCPSGQIIALILDGKLSTVSQDADVAGLAGLRVDLTELRNALPQLPMPGLTKSEAARSLHVTYPTINYLIAEGTLTSVRVRNPKSRQFLNAVCHMSVAVFKARFLTLGQLAKTYRRASGPLGCHLEAKGICPIETPAGISWFYERKGLKRRLQKAGLAKPNEKVST